MKLRLENIFNLLAACFFFLLPVMILPYGMYNISKFVLFVVFSSSALFLLFLQLSVTRVIVNIKPLFVFLFIVFLSFIFSVNKHIAIFGWEKHREGLLVFVLYAVVFLSLVTFVRSKSQFVAIFLPLSYGIFVNNIIGIYQLIFKNFGMGIIYGPRLITTFDDPNLFGGFLASALPLIFCVGYLSEDRNIKVFTWINTIALLALLIFSGSRAALLSIVLAVLLVLVISKKINYRLVLGCAILFVLVVVLNPFLQTRLIPSVFISDLLARLNGMKGALKFIELSPLLGSGADTFKYVTGDYGGFGGAHNEFITMVSNIGILGLVSFLFLVVYCFYKGMKYIKNREGFEAKCFLAVILSQLIFLFSSYSNPVVNIFLWTGLSLTICLDNIKEKRIYFIKLPKISYLFPVVFVACIFLIITALRIPIGVIFYQKGISSESNGNYAVAIENYKSAVKMVPDSEIFLTSLYNLSIKMMQAGYLQYFPNAKLSVLNIQKYVYREHGDLKDKLNKIQEYESKYDLQKPTSSP